MIFSFDLVIFLEIYITNEYSVLYMFYAAERESCRTVNSGCSALLLRLYAVCHTTCLREVIAAQVLRRKNSPGGPLYGASGMLATNHGVLLRLAERRPAVLPPVGLKTDFGQ